MFVRALRGKHAAFGIGKLIDRRGALCSVEYFDAPTSERVVHQIEQSHLEPVTIAEQTRVYHFNEAAGVWEIGRLLDDHGDSQLVQFPNSNTKHLKVESVFVRWSRPISDPTPFLATRINETPRFSDGRSAFIRSQMRQRAASMGMSALLACTIELEAHQLEVVRRILQDPVQRYLLADEVGLGKTIEAGILIRQCVLDAPDGCSILVLVPVALIGQWRAELSQKFFLERFLDRKVHVVALNDRERINALLSETTMLVIDEAHHLTERAVGDARSIYIDIAAAAPAVDRILLLSATPALHNERGFLEMLHLLDPATYPLDGEEAFRRKIQSRQELAEIVAGLTPENALYLDYTVDRITALFPDDNLLQEHSAALRAVIETMPREDDPALIEAIGRVHAHLSEVYRLHRRILRHRRRNIGGLTPDRSGAEIVHYNSSDRAALSAAIDDWRYGEVTDLDAAGQEDLWEERVRVFWKVLDRASQYPSSGSGIVGLLARQSALTGNADRFGAISTLLRRQGLFADRGDALIHALRPIIKERTKCIIFCSEEKTADALAILIATQLGIAVDRHSPSDNAWTAFNDQPDHSILVCDRRAEEGLNLQGGKKVVVHYDSPFNPNRLEQRLGRVDRYGSGDAVRSLVLACDDDPLEVAWITYLDTALKLFDRSVASLQYLIDQTIHDIARKLFTDGAEALTDLTAISSGEQGVIEREIKAIDQQDALGALGTPPADLVEYLSEVDEDWETLANDATIWLEQTLQLDRIEEGGGGKAAPFRYRYATSNQHTLIPLSTFVANCGDALDLPRANIGRTIKTIPYTFRRRTALSRSARATGVGLLRYGDPLISGMTAITEADDRGRTFAMWRFIPGYAGDPIADIFLRFDFVLEADIAPALEMLESHGRTSNAALAAIRRRGDMALPPFYRPIWLDRELGLVTDPHLLGLLESPYAVKEHDGGAFDLNLNSQRWRRLMQLPVPELDFWAEFCTKARQSAERVLRTEDTLIASLSKADQHAARVDRGRLGQLRARAERGATPSEREELAFEEELAAALRKGIRAPHVRVDAIGAIFLSFSRASTDRVSGG